MIRAQIAQLLRVKAQLDISGDEVLIPADRQAESGTLGRGYRNGSSTVCFSTPRAPVSGRITDGEAQKLHIGEIAHQVVVLVRRAETPDAGSEFRDQAD